MAKKKVEFKKEGMTGDALKFAEQLETAFNDLPESITKEESENLITEAMKAAGFTVEFKGSIVKEFDEKETGSIKNILLQQGKALSDLQKSLDNSITGDGQSELKEAYEKALPELKQIRKDGHGSRTFEMKAPVITTTSSSVTNSGTDTRWPVMGQVNTIQRLSPFVLDFVSVGTYNGPIKIWWDELPKEGDFAVTAEGAIKPLVQYKFERRTADYKKVAGYTVITDEFDMDYPSLVSLIKRLMQVDLRRKIASVIMTDLITQASPYSITTMNGQVDSADNFAAIAAAVVQLQSLGYTPNVLALNPVDAMVMRLGKASDGQYIIPPFDFNGQSIEFGNIYVHPDVPAGNFFIGDGSVYQVDFRGGVQVKIGYVNDDLIKNQYTVVVEQFFYNNISTARKAGLIYANFGAVKTLIEKP